ncbi:hypothetical protein AWRI1499_0531 [Brettanomyces bruxellensis AWRI1499]|nr:hypothetical protein AWRI1499_0531 [Brettanomyces bruxellensis AWRI1499]
MIKCIVSGVRFFLLYEYLPVFKHIQKPQEYISRLGILLNTKQGKKCSLIMSRHMKNVTIYECMKKNTTK